MNKIKSFFKRISLYCYFESRFRGTYKMFAFWPALTFTLDLQDKDYEDIDWIGSKEYSFYIEWLFWQLSICLNIKNKLDDSISNK